MTNILKLRKPIKIGEKELSELAYDAEEIAVEDFGAASGLSMAAIMKHGAMVSIAKEFDVTLHMYLGLMAIKAVNPDYSMDELKKIKGRDVVEVSNIGRDFMRDTSEETLPENPSDAASEPMAEDTTPAEATYSECD